MATTSSDELETRLAYLEDGLNQLSDVVYAQSQALERLGERCRRLEARVEALSEDSDATDDNVPPHY